MKTMTFDEAKALGFGPDGSVAKMGTEALAMIKSEPWATMVREGRIEVFAQAGHLEAVPYSKTRYFVFRDHDTRKQFSTAHYDIIVERKRKLREARLARK